MNICNFVFYYSNRYKILPLETGKLKLPGILTEVYVMDYKDKIFLHDTAF